jgi:hypothetical protein
MRVSAERAPVAEIAMPLEEIVGSNGDRLLWQIA